MSYIILSILLVLAFWYGTLVLYTDIKFKNFGLKAQNLKVKLFTPYLIYKSSFKAAWEVVSPNANGLNLKKILYSILLGFVTYSVASSMMARIYVVYLLQMKEYKHSFMEYSDNSNVKQTSSNNSKKAISNSLVNMLDGNVNTNNYAQA